MNLLYKKLIDFNAKKYYIFKNSLNNSKYLQKISQSYSIKESIHALFLYILKIGKTEKKEL
jgi:hypothetical protein